MECVGILDDEIFVGNIKAGKNLLYLGTIKYRVGNQALDIHGNKLDPGYMLPLFIKKSDFGRYNQVMDNQSRLARYKA